MGNTSRDLHSNSCTCTRIPLRNRRPCTCTNIPLRNRRPYLQEVCFSVTCGQEGCCYSGMGLPTSWRSCYDFLHFLGSRLAQGKQALHSADELSLTYQPRVRHRCGHRVKSRSDSSSLL